MNNMTFDIEDEDAFYARRDELVSSFASWLDLRVPPEYDVEAGDFGVLLDWKWSYGDGRLDDWSVADINEFLLHWCPRKISASPDFVRGFPTAVGLGMSFLAESGLQSSESGVAELLAEHAMNLQDEFMQGMADPANFGMAKSIFGHLGIDDPTELTPEDLQKAIDGFNALPEEERRAVTDPALHGSAPEPPTIGPIQMPPPEEVVASAEATPVLDRFAKLAHYFEAPGKALTATGNLKIADARALSELLETSDVYEEQFGDHTYRKRSATRFVDLDHWQWWARESGALRRKGNKLVGVKAWQQRRTKDAVAEVRRAFEVLTAFGPVSSYWSRWQQPLTEFVDESTGALFARLLHQQGPLEYDEVLEDWDQMRAELDVHEFYPGELNRTFDRLLFVLERSGLVVQSGGTLQLTPVGVAIATGFVADEGFVVDVVPRPEDITVAGLVDMVEAQSVDAGPWWQLAWQWLELQDDMQVSFVALVEELNDRNSTTLTVALASAPQDQHQSLVPLVRDVALTTHRPPHEVGSVALTWLLQNNLINVSEVDPELVSDSILATLALLGEEEPAFAVEQLERGRTTAQQVQLIGDVSQRLQQRAIPLLETIGGHHTDKSVAKAARKELYRLRSRLAERQSRR